MERSRPSHGGQGVENTGHLRSWPFSLSSFHSVYTPLSPHGIVSLALWIGVSHFINSLGATQKCTILMFHVLLDVTMLTISMNPHEGTRSQPSSMVVWCAMSLYVARLPNSL